MRLVPIVLLACVPPRNPGTIPVQLAAEPARVMELAGQDSRAVVVVRTGAAADPIGKEGLAWWVAHAIVADAEPAARVVVDEDLTTFTVPCVPEQPDCGADLGARIAAGPTPDALDRARAARPPAAAAPGGPAGAALQAVLFVGHPYGHPISGRDGVFPTFTPADAAAFHASAYVRSTVVGGVVAAPAAPLRDALADLPGRLPPDDARMAPEPVPPHTLLLSGVPGALEIRCGRALDGAAAIAPLLAPASAHLDGALVAAGLGRAVVGLGPYQPADWSGAPAHALPRRSPHLEVVVWPAPGLEQEAWSLVAATLDAIGGAALEPAPAVAHPDAALLSPLAPAADDDGPPLSDALTVDELVCVGVGGDVAGVAQVLGARGGAPQLVHSIEGFFR